MEKFLEDEGESKEEDDEDQMEDDEQSVKNDVLANVDEEENHMTLNEAIKVIKKKQGKVDVVEGVFKPVIHENGANKKQLSRITKPIEIPNPKPNSNPKPNANPNPRPS